MIEATLQYWATITKVDRRKPVLSGFKRGDDVTLNYGPEMIHIIFDNHESLVLEPDAADKLGWSVGDRLVFNVTRESKLP